MLDLLLTVYLLFNMSLVNNTTNIWTSKGDINTRQKVYNNTVNLQHEEWAKKNLHTGDIIYRSGDEVALGFNFSQYVREISDCKYSHCGIVMRIWDRTFVYDTDRAGYRRVPFSIFMKECNGGRIKVQRVKSQYRYALIPAMTYCFQQYMKNTPFDYEFTLSPDKLYCAEACVNAFKAGRLLLQEPVRAGDFPAIDQHVLKTFLVMGASYIMNERPFSLTQRIYHVGGISQSKYLKTIYEGQVK